MSSKYYKYEFKNINSLDNIGKKINEFNYSKQFECKLDDDTYFEIYVNKKCNSRTSSDNNSYVIYINSNSMDSFKLDLIINYYLQNYYTKQKIISYNRIYNVYIILDSEYFTDYIKSFIDYGISTPYFTGRKWRGKVQIPIVYIRNDKALYVSLYSGNHSGKLLIYNRNISLIKTNIQNTFSEKDYSCKLIRKSNKNIDGSLPINIIFNRYSITPNKIYIENFYISLIMSLCLNFMILDANNIFMYFFIFVIMYIFLLLSRKNNINNIIKKYKYIFIEDKQSDSIKENLINMLLSLNYSELGKNYYVRGNKNIYFYDKTSDNLVLNGKKFNIVIITDQKINFDYKKYKNYENSIFVLQYYKNDTLKILTPDNIYLKRFFLKIMEKYYNK